MVKFTNKSTNKFLRLYANIYIPKKPILYYFFIENHWVIYDIPIYACLCNLLYWPPQPELNQYLILRRDSFYPIELWGDAAHYTVIYVF